MRFDEIVAPLEARTFTGEYLGRQPLHLQGQPDKFHQLMNWDVLNQLLDMTSIWSSVSLLMVMDKEPVPKDSYATPTVGRDGFSVLRPDPRRVKEHLARGATLVFDQKTSAWEYPGEGPGVVVGDIVQITINAELVLQPEPGKGG